MDMEWINLVGNVGFPIFTAVYFMTRMETQMRKTNELLTVLIERTERERKAG